MCAIQTIVTSGGDQLLRSAEDTTTLFNWMCIVKKALQEHRNLLYKYFSTNPLQHHHQQQQPQGMLHTQQQQRQQPQGLLHTHQQQQQQPQGVLQTQQQAALQSSFSPARSAICNERHPQQCQSSLPGQAFMQTGPQSGTPLSMQGHCQPAALGDLFVRPAFVIAPGTSLTVPCGKGMLKCRCML